MSIWLLHFDGLCEANPGGVMAWGWTLRTHDVLHSDGNYIPARPDATSNIAEYCAAGCGLKRLVQVLTVEGPWGCDGIEVRGDSRLVINQLSGEWKCKSSHLVQLRARCVSLIMQIKKLSGHAPKLVWIPREENEAADKLSREAYCKCTGEMPVEREEVKNKNSNEVPT